MLRNFHVAAFATLLALPVGAYVHSLNFAGRPLMRAPEDAANVEFFMHEGMVAGATNGGGLTILTADSDPLGGLQQAGDHWNTLPDTFLRTRVVTTTNLPIDSEDTINVISFANTPELRAAVFGALAFASLFSGTDGIITDSDIVFSDAGNFGGRNLPFSTNVEEDTIHMTSVASHEIGHTHGLGHSGVAGATMFARTSNATDIQERPKGDEITFARDVYGVPDVGARFGSIQGTISLSGGDTANGVFVAVVDPTAGFIVSTLTDFDNGTYDTGPIPAGSYFVVAEPVDGPAERFDYPRTNPASFNLDVREGFFGGNSSAQAPQAVTVTPGKNIANANFAIEGGAKTLDIQLLGISDAGVRAIDRFGPSPRELNPGEAKDILLWGPGLPDGIGDGNVRIFGDAVTIRPGTVRVDPDFTLESGGVERGFLRMTVDVAVGVQGTPLASIAVFKDGEAAVFTGGLVIKGGGVQNPEFTSAGLTNGASFVAGDVAEEEIVTLFGLFLADFSEGFVLPLGTQLGGGKRRCHRQPGGHPALLDVRGLYHANARPTEFHHRQ